MKKELSLPEKLDSPINSITWLFSLNDDDPCLLKEVLKAVAETPYFHSIDEKFEWRIIKKDEEKSSFMKNVFSRFKATSACFESWKARKTSWAWKSFVFCFFLVQLKIYSSVRFTLFQFEVEFKAGWI